MNIFTRLSLLLLVWAAVLILGWLLFLAVTRA